MPIIHILNASGEIENAILADESTAQALYPGRWRLAEQQELPAPAPQTHRHITPLAFRRRFTGAERAAIEWAAVDRADATSGERQQAAQLRSTLKDQELASFIDLDDPDVAAGVQLLETVGLIADGRALQITDTPPRPDELPA
ncbi:hypothetical protein [Delftia acidovorans]|uniref:hypothetical protein n=1 Tax=Delftia acidovorans TaxID=80866 RepID=UPI001EE0C28E|nr:hypothetical protein [Delftia acidovorans]MCG3785730.1 hypothetical protein [Delftia acidovorans]